MNDNSENIVMFIKETVETEISNKYSVDFNQSTFSLTLKNIQKTDSGLYTAKILGLKFEDAAKYRVSVIDPVDYPVLNWNVTMIAVNSCIVNISCSGHDRTISGRYHSNNCSQEEVALFGMQNLTLNCKEDIVICNYSNPVSWKNDTIQITQLCTNETPEESHTSFALHWLIVIVISASFLVAAAVIYHSYKNHNNGMSVLFQMCYQINKSLYPQNNRFLEFKMVV
uniref:Uncharacterized protein n=1 Tax=Cyprinus carpio TaxID=7962 RepID=A0A8C1QU62_CYPCA